MAETEFLNLPLLAAAQSQKHVTVNEALSRLDGLVQMVLENVAVTAPPAVVNGVWGIGSGATDAWFGQDGRIAIAANGGWDFVTPAIGWKAHVRATGAQAIFDGSEWATNAQTLSPNGAGIALETIEIDHLFAAGAESTTQALIPAQSTVLAVTGRVLQSISGTATSFSLGLASESIDRYGSGYGLSTGSFLRGITSAPLTYYSDTPLTFTADGGTFSGGEVRLSVHLMRYRLPRA